MDLQLWPNCRRIVPGLESLLVCPGLTVSTVRLCWALSPTPRMTKVMNKVVYQYSGQLQVRVLPHARILGGCNHRRRRIPPYQDRLVHCACVRCGDRHGDRSSN
uniref:Uncharacterized protein n=1 Tax=Arundo donax TaxID=35708 RepID=A0A0A9D8T4_ARUDO